MTSYGVQNTDATRTVDATFNWWGLASGPTGVGASPASANVTYTNWWTTPTSNTNGVYNVVAQRIGGSMLVDVFYDLLGDAGTHYRVSIAVSKTGGQPYVINPVTGSLSGDFGAAITPGY